MSTLPPKKISKPPKKKSYKGLIIGIIIAVTVVVITIVVIIIILLVRRNSNSTRTGGGGGDSTGDTTGGGDTTTGAECAVDGDCGTGVCQNGVCCDLTPVTLSSTITKTGDNWNQTIAGSYTASQGIETGDQVIVSVYDAEANLIYEKPPVAANGSYSITANEISFPLLGMRSINADPNITYQFGLEFLRSCGTTESSTLQTFQITNNQTATPFAFFGPNATATGTTVNFFIPLRSPTFSVYGNSPRFGILARNGNFNTNFTNIAQYDVLQRNLSGIFQYSDNGVDIYNLGVTWPAAASQTWQWLMWVEGSPINGSTNSLFHVGTVTF